jgi:hypothetical protein
VSYPTFVTDDVVYDLIASTLHLVGGTDQLLQQATSWGTIVPYAHQKAVGEIYRAFAGRGFVPTQIVAWDDGATFETILAVGDALAMGNVIDQAAPDVVAAYYEYKQTLVGIALTIAGVPQFPQGTYGTAVTGTTGPGNGRGPLLPSGSRHSLGYWGEGYDWYGWGEG